MGLLDLTLIDPYHRDTRIIKPDERREKGYYPNQPVYNRTLGKALVLVAHKNNSAAVTFNKACYEWFLEIGKICPIRHLLSYYGDNQSDRHQSEFTRKAIHQKQSFILFDELERYLEDAKWYPGDYSDYCILDRITFRPVYTVTKKRRPLMYNDDKDEPLKGVLDLRRSVRNYYDR